MNRNNLNLGPVVGPGIQSTGGKKFEDGLKQGSPGECPHQLIGYSCAVKQLLPWLCKSGKITPNCLSLPCVTKSACARQ